MLKTKSISKYEVFDKKVIKINSNIDIDIIDIEKIDSNLLSLIDSNFVKICEGNSGTSIDITKERVKHFLNSKNTETKMGAIAEFFVHLYLSSFNYKQECLFLNMEEGSIKKGFDGYYSKQGEEWIMESKSGFIHTKNISHCNKLKEAYKDLTQKIEGKVSNNPWHNAYNHASHIDVGTSKDIRTHIKKISDDYTNKLFYHVDSFNIIPCATIFMDGTWKPKDKNVLVKEVRNILGDFQCKKIKVICITQKSIDLFMDYLAA